MMVSKSFNFPCFFIKKGIEQTQIVHFSFSDLEIVQMTLVKIIPHPQVNRNLCVKLELSLLAFHRIARKYDSKWYSNRFV